MFEKKIVAIIQARVSSKRFPSKVLQLINGKSVILWVINRIKQCSEIDKICIATTNDPTDDELVNHLKSEDVYIFRGENEDVLSRYYHSAKEMKASYIIRITADCPFVDPFIISKVINHYKKNEKLDYVSNTLSETYPDGLDVEMFSFNALKLAHFNASSLFEREHVTPYIKNNCSVDNVYSEYSFAKDLRLTIDEPIDLKVLNQIVMISGLKDDFKFADIVNIYKKEPQIFSKNMHLTRNFGSKLTSSEKIWKRAKKVIPGGTMLFSKRPELFLPGIWPTYYKKCKGISVWDMDSKHYLDFSYMGVGTNTLGYGCEIIDKAVSSVIKKGNLCTLNNPDEVLLAEKLIDISPGQEMVRFTRSGGEANAVAIRIARAATSKTNVAICGYHGWHDWYLSANHENENNLSKHLLKGLGVDGVPKQLSGLTIPFLYNDINELKNILSSGKVSAVKMEVKRNIEPNSTFLKDVRELCDRKNVILIFDECTSGFRETYGGLYKKYDVVPDMLIYGKTLGNGYAINAILGKREVMEAAQNTFISSTFWTEAIGTAAAIATLNEMKRIESWKIISDLGEYFNKGLKKIAKKNSINIDTYGLKPLRSFTFEKWHLERKTFLTKEMLKLGWLATNAFYASTVHTKKNIDDYLNDLDTVFHSLKDLDFDDDITRKKIGNLCHSGFKRLN